MLDLVVLYRVPEDGGRPVPVVSSADPELVAAVAKLVGAQLGLTQPGRVLGFSRPAAEKEAGR